MRLVESPKHTTLSLTFAASSRTPKLFVSLAIPFASPLLCKVLVKLSSEILQ